MSRSTPTLRCERVVLRAWTADDRTPFAALNADPLVMEHFPSPLDRAASDDLAERIEAHLREHGFGLWALEAPDLGFAGFVGLNVPAWEAPFTPCVEAGWRLARAAWGRGYAAEAARAVLRFAFAELRLAEVVSFTVPANQRSRALMERVGMVRDLAGDFDHPRLPPGHPLARHVLYRLKRERWDGG
jgi:RimJ/RimL family protein N-acetyltransferase